VTVLALKFEKDLEYNNLVLIKYRSRSAPLSFKRGDGDEFELSKVNLVRKV